MLKVFVLMASHLSRKSSSEPLQLKISSEMCTNSNIGMYCYNRSYSTLFIGTSQIPRKRRARQSARDCFHNRFTVTYQAHGIGWMNSISLTTHVLVRYIRLRPFAADRSIELGRRLLLHCLLVFMQASPRSRDEVCTTAEAQSRTRCAG